MVLGLAPFVEMYHLTSRKTFNAILRYYQSNQKPSILARSHPYWRLRFDIGVRREILRDFGVNFRKLSEIVKADRYIVGFQEAIPRGWIEAGLMIALLQHIQNKTEDDMDFSYPIYSFHLVVPKNRIFVRDHYFTSPMYFIKKYNFDYWNDYLRNSSKYFSNLSNPTIRPFWEGLAAYFNSSRKWSDYETEGKRYIAPELWYSGDYYIDNSEGIKEIGPNGLKILTLGMNSKS